MPAEHGDRAAIDATDEPVLTAWRVITGPPSAGKTSVIEALAARGHRTVPESARAHIAALGHRPEAIAADGGLRVAIQQGIARRQRGVELDLRPDEPLFLDRALPDSIAYFQRAGLSVEPLVADVRRRRYRRVFYLEGLPLDRDGLRFEDDGEAAALGEAILAAYAMLDYFVVRVPAYAGDAVEVAVQRRVELILSRVG
jgi:predicted ATPase